MQVSKEPLNFARKILTGWVLLVVLQTLPAGAGVTFSDNFDRPDDAASGNGWSEADESNLSTRIESNSLVMSQSGFLSASSEDTQDTRIYRSGKRHKNVTLTGTLSISFSDPGGASQAVRLAVRSAGTEGSGFVTNPNTGAISYLPCGIQGTPPPECWHADGYGFLIFADRDASPLVQIQIVDNGEELAKVTDFSFPPGTVFNWEMQVNARNHIALFVWNGTSKPTTPTLSFNNGMIPYTPLANGDFWQLEVRNTNDDFGLSHAHAAIWDNFQVRSGSDEDGDSDSDTDGDSDSDTDSDSDSDTDSSSG